MEFGFEIVGAKPKGQVVDPPINQAMRAGPDKIRRQPSTDQLKVRREMQRGVTKKALQYDPDVEWEVQGDYGYGDGWEALTTENSKDEAYARLREYDDNEPGVPHRVKRMVATGSRLLSTLRGLTTTAVWHSDDDQITAQFEKRGNRIVIDVVHPMGFETHQFPLGAVEAAAQWVDAFDVEVVRHETTPHESVMTNARAAVLRGSTEAKRIVAAGPQVHEFADTGEAYDETQVNEDIHQGDVLLIESEGVVGFLLSAWPTAVTAEPGNLHQLTDPSAGPQGEPSDKPEDVAAWQAGWKAARELATSKGWALDGEAKVGAHERNASIKTVAAGTPAKGTQFRVIKAWRSFGDMVSVGPSAWSPSGYTFQPGEILTFEDFKLGFGSDPAFATVVTAGDGFIHTSNEGWTVDPHLDPANGFVELVTGTTAARKTAEVATGNCADSICGHPASEHDGQVGISCSHPGCECNGFVPSKTATRKTAGYDDTDDFNYDRGYDADDPDMARSREDNGDYPFNVRAVCPRDGEVVEATITWGGQEVICPVCGVRIGGSDISIVGSRKTAYDESSFLNESIQLTQEEAQYNRFAVGVWSEDQYEAYMIVWARGKIGSEAEMWNARGPSTPEVARLVDAITEKLASR